MNHLDAYVTRVSLLSAEKDAKGGYQTGLLKVGRFDADLDLIELEADSKLWELFQLDYRVLLQHHALRPSEERSCTSHLHFHRKPSAESVAAIVRANP